MKENSYVLYNRDIVLSTLIETMMGFLVLGVAIVVAYIITRTVPACLVCLAIIYFVTSIIHLVIDRRERKSPTFKTLVIDKSGITLAQTGRDIQRIVWRDIQSIIFRRRRTNIFAGPMCLYLKKKDGIEEEFNLCLYNSAINPYQLSKAITIFSGQEDIVKTESPLWFMGVNPFHSGYVHDNGSSHIL